MPSILGLVLAAAPFLTLLLAAWVVGRAAERSAPYARLPRAALADLTLPIFITALVVARLVQILPAWRSVVANPLDLLRFTGAGQLSPLGGIVGAGLGFLLFTRRRGLPLLRTADLYGLVLPLGIAVHSGGCLVRGDCYGRVAPAPFGIVFPGFELPHYPVGLYAAALALFVYAGLTWFAQQRPAQGAIALAAVTATAGSYALLSPLRLETTPVLLDTPQALAVALALGALFVAQIIWLFKSLRPQPLTSALGNVRGWLDTTPEIRLQTPTPTHVATSEERPSQLDGPR